MANKHLINQYVAWRFKKPQREDAGLLKNILALFGDEPRDRDRRLKSEFYHDYIVALATETESQK